MQSHWPWYELIIFTFIAKFFNIPIVFNQNGIYKKSYKNTYWISNFIINNFAFEFKNNNFSK